MPIIVIGSTSIDFPNTGSSPIWSEAVIQFAEAVELALSGLVSVGDIPKQTFTLDSSHNPGTDITITGFSFSAATVRAGFVKYSVFRSTNTNTVYEMGEMDVIFSNANPPGSKWELQQQRVSDAQITFVIDDSGQFSFSTTAIPGTGHTGKIVFSATAFEQ